MLQADLCGFTTLSSTTKPDMLMRLLGDLFNEFDELCEEHGVHKLKTIGDACIVARKWMLSVPPRSLPAPPPPRSARLADLGSKKFFLVY